MPSHCLHLASGRVMALVPSPGLYPHAGQEVELSFHLEPQAPVPSDEKAELGARV